MAIRIGALQARGVEFTLAALDEAARLEELQKLLLLPALMERAGELTTESLHGLGNAAAELMVVPSEKVRLVALSEETLAEEAWKEERVEALPAVVESKPGAGLEEEEVRRIFTPDQTAKLKLTLLTGVDPREKVQALRQLEYAPLPAEEKGMLTLKCLGDPDSDVRKEAAGALQALGLKSELAEALAGVAGGTVRQRAMALERVESLLRGSSDTERRVVLSSLVAGLRNESETIVLQANVRALRPCADLLRDNPESLTFLTRHIVRVLIEHYDGVRSDVRALYEAVAEGSKPEAADAVWKEVHSISDLRLRRFFYASLCLMCPGKELRAELAERLAGEFLKPGKEDLEFRSVVAASRALGDEMVD